ncbi:MAG: hypothetical protein KDK70_24900, partial [Myxococcales bacterium]|nr:hypothetical protein [Myxococcales bacterium]
MDMDALLREIRSACSAPTWSRGVELARSGAVVGISDDGDEVELRVTMGSGTVSPVVVLFPDEQEWDCECSSPERACMHVAAAAIALKQAREGGGELPEAAAGASPAAVAYRLLSLERRLALRRVIELEGEDDRPIRASLKQAGQGLGRPLVTTEADLRFEKRFGSTGAGVIAREQLADVLRALSKVERLSLDGEPVRIGPPISGLCVRVWEVGDDLRAELEQDPGIDRIYENGALLRAGVLGALGEHGLPEAEFRRLRRGWTFAPDELGTLAGERMPRWRRRVPVIVQTDRLPEARTMAPRLQVATTRVGDALEVLATVVYGDPAVARLDGDRLTLLRAGQLAPIRNHRLEKEVLRQLRALELEPGVRRRLSADEALAWRARADRVEALDWQGQGHRTFFDAGELRPRLHPGGGS